MKTKFNQLLIMGITTLLFLGSCQSKEIPVLYTEFPKDLKLQENLLLGWKDGEFDTLFRCSYYLEEDSVYFEQAPYLGIAVEVSKELQGDDFMFVRFTYYGSREGERRMAQKLMNKKVKNYIKLNDMGARQSFSAAYIFNVKDWMHVNGFDEKDMGKDAQNYFVSIVGSQLEHTDYSHFYYVNNVSDAWKSFSQSCELFF